MKAGKPLAFILLAFVIGATVSQGSFAFADDSSTNPFRAIWDAIGELQFKTESLQAQIDELKSLQGTVSAAQTVTKNSEASLAIDVSGGSSGQTLMTLIVRNAGPDSAVGVKLTAFYQRSLFQVNFVQGAECSDGSRGIIECYLGTVVTGSEARVVVDATPVSIGQQAIITADLSSITTDSNLANNHAEAVFVTSVAPVALPSPSPAPSEVPVVPTEQPAQEQTEGEQSSEEQSGEQASEQQTTEEQSTEQPSEQGSESSEQAGSGEESSSEASGEQGEGSTDSGTGESSGDSGTAGSGESGNDSGGAEGGASSDGGSAGDTGSAGEGSSDAGAGDGGATSSDSGSAGTDSGSGDGDSGAGGEGGSSGDSGSGGDGGGSDGGSAGGDSGTG